MVTATRKPRTVKPAHGSCRWVRRVAYPFPGILEINGTTYTVIPLTGNRSGPEAPALGYRLLKPDGRTWYDIGLEHQDCTCPSYVWDHSHTDGRCKHVAALRAAGLLARPASRVRQAEVA